MNERFETNRVVRMLACMMFAFLAGCTSQQVIRTERAQVGHILVRSSPSARVVVNGQAVGWTPLRVPVHRVRHTVEEVRHKGTQDTFIQVLITGMLTLAFPPMGLACGAAFSEKNFDVKKEVRQFDQWEETSMVIALERDGYRPTQMRVKSNQFPRYWRPTLAALPREPDPVETARKVAQSAGRTSADFGRVMKELDEIVDQSRQTRERLLKKAWDTSGTD